MRPGTFAPGGRRVDGATPEPGRLDYGYLGPGAGPGRDRKGKTVQIEGAPKWLSAIVNITTAIATVVLPVLVDNRVISSAAGAVAGAIIAALAGGHHVTAVAVNRSTNSAAQVK